MHKLTKGLKKTKKKKKSKKKGEEELFDSAELEEYRRTHQQRQEEGQSQNQEGGGAQGSEGDEWQQFKALTAGVDSVLKKTQGDLDRIRETSYFQRKKTASQQQQQEEKEAQQKSQQEHQHHHNEKDGKHWVGFEEGAAVDAEEIPEAAAAPPAPATATRANLLEAEPVHFEESAAEEESEEESEEEDDGLFDTSYVDVVTSGEVKLAYIPDSPTLPEDKDDPFDTSIADSIVKDAERERLKKPVVSLGIAVDVLTGKVPVTSPCLPAKSPSKRTPRKTEVDLLLGSFDENGNTEISVHETVSQPSEPKSLLDDLELTAEPAVPLLETALGEAPLPVAEPKKKEEEREEKEDVKNLLAEFDLIASVPSEPTCEVVAAPPAALVAVSGDDDDLEDEFAALAARKGSDAFRVEEDQPDADPFDTTAAAVVLGEDTEVAAFTSRAPQQRSPRTFPISPDVDIVLASDSPPVHWTAFDDDEAGYPRHVETFPEEHVQALAEDIGATLADPFDTSFAENILPGKAELKLIEDEILGGRLAVNEESILLRSSESDVEDQVFHVQSTVSIHITDPAGCDRGDGDDGLTSLTLGHRDLLGGSTTDLSKLAHEPIEPAAPAPAEEEDSVASYADPFDTSVVDVIAAPGRTELKYIEQELLGEASQEPKRKLSDPDFDPRAAEAIVDKVVIDAEAAVQKQRPDLLLTQQQQPKVVAFDLPTPTERPDLLAVGVEEAGKVISKPLTPYYTEAKPVVQGVDSEIIDPFDTSFADNIAPGKAELRILESELFGGPSPAPISRCLSDPDFDPRGEEAKDQEQQPEVRVPQGRRLSESPAAAPSHPELSRRRFSDLTGSRTLPPPSSLPIAKSPRPDLLLVEEEEAEVVPKPLTPLPDRDTFSEADPFDTSAIPDAILPGRAELKVLESELIDGSLPLSLKRSYTDPDFNPREDNPPQAAAPPAAAERPDLLDLPDGEESQAPHKPLTPAGDVSTETVIDDPFDTSIVGNLVPGRAELRILESELIGQ